MKSNKVLKILRISRPTLSKYVKEGIIKAYRLPNGHFNFDEDSVYRFLNNGMDRKTYIYCRSK